MQKGWQVTLPAAKYIIDALTIDLSFVLDDLCGGITGSLPSPTQLEFFQT
jgi:hypothetical protein